MPAVRRTTLGDIREVNDLIKKVYDSTDIKNYDLLEGINDHPFANKAANLRSKLAYAAIMRNLRTTNHYVLPGQITLFGYSQPKFKEKLAYYDATPFCLSFGIFRTEEGNIREVMLNFHYFPPFARVRILNNIYNAFRPYFSKFFNDIPNKPNSVISYNVLKHILKHNDKIAFATKEYIPVLRGRTYKIPSKMISTAAYTEGHFSKTTMQQIFNFWRKF